LPPPLLTNWLRQARTGSSAACQSLLAAAGGQGRLEIIAVLRLFTKTETLENDGFQMKADYGFSNFCNEIWLIFGTAK
jgi:hypothetical protein